MDSLDWLSRYEKKGILMKKYINLAFIYALVAMGCGIFYREFTKFNNFTQKTTLSVAHAHLFLLGAVLFLIIGIICQMSNLETQKNFKRFYLLYNIGLPFMVLMFMVRGIIQVLAIQLSKGMTATISGIAGISHIIVGASIVLLFVSLKQMKIKSK